LHGDFGVSITNKMRVSELLRRLASFRRYGVTTPLFILDLCLAVGLALLAAYFSWNVDRSLPGGGRPLWR